ncbi:thermolysin metallopeptidase-like protein [Kribbella sp. VKM Ac-2527]|uniref:Neutral metalloproteinase n=1 Tax=Kribbella caucasensis TaxID=2512215 RepID=A0A4R6KUF5_9ACTN|nr:M4 family metallopeptidase [Kribbella sp. VKM Ac-2527]TDO54727.1 thermolysin metallopeptidase-like protein [Kribbella sp. VKM Ac-2527]
MTVHHIVPPYLLERLEQTADDPTLRARYRQSLDHDAMFRTRPAASTTEAPAAPTTEAPAAEGAEASEAQGEAAAPSPQRAIHDAEHETALPGNLVRSEGDPDVPDTAVNESYDGLGATWSLFHECFGRDSIDGAGVPLISTVHFDRDYVNAFWNGEQMVFGDGDGVIFRSFTSSIDITGHELTHGVVQHTAGLAYEGQAGALTESLCDVFGSLAKQHHLGQAGTEADWIIGAGIFTDGVAGVGIRSLAQPGSAYDDPRLGRDPQPSHMSDYVDTEDDNGGVHLNSGIPNHAFYLVATTLGGNAYEDPGRIWYTTLTSGDLPATCTFAQFAAATQQTAESLFGPESPQAQAVTTAWTQVGVLPTATPSRTESIDLMRAAQTGLDTSTPPAPASPTPTPTPTPTPPTPTPPTSTPPTSTPPTSTPPTPSDSAPSPPTPAPPSPPDSTPEPPATDEPPGETAN